METFFLQISRHSRVLLVSVYLRPVVPNLGAGKKKKEKERDKKE